MSREITIISGKGGTGKTSLVGSLACFAENSVFVDCDVDAADLHLILKGKKETACDFIGGKRADIIRDLCTDCGVCLDYCRFDAVTRDEKSGRYDIDPFSCEGCGICAHFCPEKAIEMNDVKSGQWFISETKYGPLVHARLGIAEANSGKLVSVLRNTAKVIAEKNSSEYIVIDGSPGIGCPVIASLTGVDYVLIMTEPSVSAIHDMDRLLDLIEHFKINCGIVINKADINREYAVVIRDLAEKRSLKVLAEFPYDTGVTDAQIAGLPYAEFAKGEPVERYRRLWRNLIDEISKNKKVDKTNKIQLQWE